jgi:hypothetical protein
MNEVNIKFDWVDNSDDVESLIEIFSLVRDKYKIKEQEQAERKRKAQLRKKKKEDDDDDDEQVLEDMIPTLKKYSKDELQTKTMEELKTLCRERKIIGYSKLNKDNLINKLI